MKYSIFCDESGIIGERYMVLGGIILPINQVHIISKKIKSIKEQEGLSEHEVKFCSLKNVKKLYLYQKILSETYFNKEHNIDFRCIIFDTTQVSHKDFNHAYAYDSIHPKERGFYKQYYQLFYHQFFKVHIDGIFYCYLDEKGSKKTSSVCIEELRYYLREMIGNRIITLESFNSKCLELLQLADLLVGSVALVANDRSSRKEKLELVNFITSKKNCRNLSEPSYNLNFKVWRFNYNKSKKVPIG